MSRIVNKLLSTTGGLAPAPKVAITYETSDLKPEGSGATRNFTYALPAAKIIFFVRTVQGFDFNISVGGNAATLLLEDYFSTDKPQVACFEYDNTVTSPQTISLTYSEEGDLESIVDVYSVLNAASVTASQTLPQSSLENGGLMFMSSTSNQASAIPTQTNALTVNYNQDIRSGENHYTAHINGDTTISTNATLSGSVQFITVVAKTDFDSVSLLLHGDGTNGAQNNTFLDSSSNNFTITRNGNTTQGSFSPYNVSGPYNPATHGGSGYFDGTEDYVTIPADTALNITGGNFTIEAWVYPTTNAIQLIASQDDGLSGGTDQIFQFRLESNGQLSFIYWYSSSRSDLNSFNSTGAVPINAWTHVAVTFDGSNIKLFINGVQDGSVAETSIYSANVVTSVASLNTGAASFFNGYISDVRIVKGTALYTTNFTPPTAPLTAVTNTSLLCNFTNAGIFDSTGKNVLETVGNAQIDTAVTKFGTGSMEFDGTGDYLSIPESTELTFGASNFTIEFWLYLNTAADGDTVISQGTSAQTDNWQLSFASSKLRLFYSNLSSSDGSTTLSTSQWYHIAIVGEGSTIKVYVDGTLDDTVSYSYNYGSYVTRVGINRGGSVYLDGYIDDLRITKGVARYTANFTPPTKAFPDQ